VDFLFGLARNAPHHPVATPVSPGRCDPQSHNWTRSHLPMPFDVRYDPTDTDTTQVVGERSDIEVDHITGRIADRFVIVSLRLQPAPAI
jgi:hypothetical protein